MPAFVQLVVDLSLGIVAMSIATGVIALSIRRAALFDRKVVAGHYEGAFPNWRQSAILALLAAACFVGLWLLVDVATTEHPWSPGWPSFRTIGRLWIVPLVCALLFVALAVWIRLPLVSAYRVAIGAACYTVGLGVVILFCVVVAARVMR